MATKVKKMDESATKVQKTVALKPALAKKNEPKLKPSIKASQKTESSSNSKSDKEIPKLNSGATSLLSETKQKKVKKVADDKVESVSKVLEKVEEQADTQVLVAEGAEKKWQEIKHILERLKEATLREIKKSVKNGTEAIAAIEPGGDIYDQASSERDRELGLLLGDREREKIHSIDEALLRIDEGEYGICEECDEDIPLGRLKAMPFTRHCVKCKSDLEKMQAQTKRVEEERAYREIPLGADDEES
ncbi:MAG: TraR/DksA family transcriptional regulator [Desulfuromonadaceae bacterium]|nr:TraR/DksA family transcriptional regulator [Desulfuromonadaceae bacterium]MDD2855731.1 TraR/DksA family transcriptional regulator [Desulfuromonadaceae bacterium]